MNPSNLKKTGYHPVDPVLNPDETDPVDMMNNLMKRASGVYESMTRKPLQCPTALATMSDLHETYQPLTKWGVPYGRHAAQTAMRMMIQCTLLPVVLLAPFLTGFFEWYEGQSGHWLSLISPKRLALSYSSWLKWYTERFRQCWVNIVSPESALRDTIIECLDSDD